MATGPDSRIIDPTYTATNGQREVPVIILDADGNPVSVGGGTQYDRGSVSTATDKLTMAGVVRADVAASPSGVIDGDRSVLLTDADGKLWVNAAVTIAGVATSAKQDTGNTSLASIDGKITAVNTGAVVVASSALPTGAATAAGVSALDGDVGGTADAAATVGSTGSLNAKLRLMTTQLNTVQTSVQLIDDIVSGAGANISQVGGVNIALNTGTVSTGTQRVVLATDVALPAGTALLGKTGIDQTTPGTTNAVAGGLAHDAVNTSGNNPSVVGMEAIAHGTNPTAVSAGDVTKQYANRAGIPFTLGGHPNIVTLRANYTTAQTDTAIVTVAGGLKIVVTQCAVLTDKATTVNVQARVGFGAANTPTTTGVVLSHPGLAAGSGYNRGDGSGILGIGADGEDLRITSAVPTTGSIDVLVSYFTVES